MERVHDFLISYFWRATSSFRPFRPSPSSQINWNTIANFRICSVQIVPEQILKFYFHKILNFKSCRLGEFFSSLTPGTSRILILTKWWTTSPFCSSFNHRSSSLNNQANKCRSLSARLSKRSASHIAMNKWWTEQVGWVLIKEDDYSKRLFQKKHQMCGNTAVDFCAPFE